MALIDCPACKKKISSKAKQCNHCNLDMVNLDVDKVKQLNTVSNIQKQQQITTQSFVAMLLFCGGFLFSFWQNPPAGSTQQIIAITAACIGFVWYIINRVRLLVLKRK